MAVDLRDWGPREYRDALEAMRRLRMERRDGTIPDTLILVEHPPVVTVGVGGTGGEALPPGIPVVEVERGGQATYHGPGQLVGYPIVDLTPRGRDVRRFVHEVEELVVRALAEMGQPAARRPGLRGVWTPAGRKIASVGIAVTDWVSMHGFALNVSNDLAPFESFHPCGLPGATMTSLERELGHPVSVDALKPAVRRAWESLFDGPSLPAGEPLRTAPPVSG